MAGAGVGNMIVFRTVSGCYRKDSDQFYGLGVG